MALGLTAVNVYTSGSGHGTGSFVTSSFTPASNSLLCVAVTGVNNATSAVDANLTLAGGGWTYTRRIFIETVLAGSDFCAWYTAPVATGASMTLTVDCGADNIYTYMVHVFTLTGYNTSTPTGATGTFTGAGGAGSRSYDLNASPASSSYVMAVAVSDAGGDAVTAGTGWTPQFNSSPDVKSQSQSRTASTSTTVLFNSLAAGDGTASVAVEIKEEAAVTGPPTPGPLFAVVSGVGATRSITVPY